MKTYFVLQKFQISKRVGLVLKTTFFFFFFTRSYLWTKLGISLKQFLLFTSSFTSSPITLVPLSYFHTSKMENCLAITWNSFQGKYHDYMMLWYQPTMSESGNQQPLLCNYKRGRMYHNIWQTLQTPSPGISQIQRGGNAAPATVVFGFHGITKWSLTKSIILSPSSSLQFLFFSRWASSMTTQRHGIFRSSGQSVKIISKVVMMAWNL